MTVSESTLAVRLPRESAAELEELARETGRSKSHYARQAIIEFLEDRRGYLRAIATLRSKSRDCRSNRRRRLLAWTIEFEQDAIRQLNRLDQSVRRRIVEYLELRVAASGDPRQFGKRLRREKAGLWSYRVGDYRVIALIEDRSWSWWSSLSAIVATFGDLAAEGVPLSQWP